MIYISTTIRPYGGITIRHDEDIRHDCDELPKNDMGRGGESRFFKTDKGYKCCRCKIVLPPVKIILAHLALLQISNRITVDIEKMAFDEDCQWYSAKGAFPK